MPFSIPAASPHLPFLPIAILLFLFDVVGSAKAEEPERPNLILILADDLGYGDVGCYGAPDIETPAMDSLAASGMRFLNMRANCTVCSPTRAAILTGRYADQVGVPGVIRTHAESNFGYFDPEVPTLANRLSDAGYHTAIVGKWHLGLESPNTPNERGFDFFHGFLGDMMEDYYTHIRNGKNFMRLDDQVIEPEGHASDLFTDWAIDYVRDRSKAGQPFFLYLAYNAPHFPIQPPDDYLAQAQRNHPESSLERRKNIGLVEHLDHCIARLLTHLDEMGLSENTMVAFTSDNGGSLPHAQRNLPWRDGKQSHYDGGLKIPFLVRYPGNIQAGSQSSYAGLTFDLAATFLQYAGAPTDPESDAVSLMPVFEGESLPDDRLLYFVRREGNRRYVGKAYHAVVRGNWKLTQNDPFSPLELFDLENDPIEQNDLSTQQPEIVGQLKDAMRTQIQAGGAVPWQRPLPLGSSKLETAN